jgi:hypothetical protein
MAVQILMLPSNLRIDKWIKKCYDFYIQWNFIPLNGTYCSIILAKRGREVQIGAEANDR